MFALLYMGTTSCDKTGSKDATKDSAAPPAPNLDGFLLKAEVAARLRKKPRTIDRWMAQGLIPHIKVGRGKRAAVLFKWADVEASLQANCGCGGAL